MKIEAIETESIPQRVVDRITRMISDGQLKPGDKLPPQRELACSLGVGFSSLREALQSLQVQGLLEIKRGQGMFVTQDLATPLANHMNLSLLVKGRFTRDLFELREILECNIVVLAAKRATAEDIQKLGRLTSAMADSIERKDAAELNESNIQFHAALAESAHNSVIPLLFSRLGDVLWQQIRFPNSFSPENFQYHRDVYLAIKDRDPERAREAMAGHFRDSWQRIEPLVSDDASQLSDEKLLSR